MTSKELDLIFEAAEGVSLSALAEMDEDECVVMVRDFCRVMADWQPSIATQLDDPMSLGVACLSMAHLFQECFIKAYDYSSRKVDAISALKQALGEEE